MRVGCLARALENRMFVAQAVTTRRGAVGSPALDVNTGEAALIAPMDVGLPHDGIPAQTRGDEAWAVAELDFEALDASRAQAQVANDRDWTAQYFPTVLRARGWNVRWITRRAARPPGMTDGLAAMAAAPPRLGC